MPNCLTAAVVAGAMLLRAGPSGAQSEAPPVQASPSEPEPRPTAVPEPEASPPTRIAEEVVVTPCRGCLTKVVNSPASVSVISAEAIASAPDRSTPELLRAVPGVNVVRYSNRDWNVTSRQATSTLANSQLVLVDGRSVYLDFIGVVLWDLVPVDPLDIDQIEVVRGPASAVWGANAFTGVVNILTKAPAKSEGSSLMVSFSSFDREAGSTVGQGGGAAYGATTSLSRAISEKSAYRISGGYAASDPWPRPVGFLPLVPHPLQPDFLVGGGELPADAQGEPGEFKNRGSTQPHVDLRIDQQAAGGTFVYEAGIAGTSGIIHTGIGPFNLESGTYLGHLRARYARGLFHVAATANLAGIKSTNLLAVDAAEEPLRLHAQTRSYDLEANHSRLIGTRHLMTYGGNARRDTFAISLAPAAQDRTELGVYLQEEFFTTLGGGAHPQALRLAVSLRLDKFGNIAKPVLSPRAALLWKPGPDHSLRVSVNRAFRSPSAINNFLDARVLSPVDLAFYFPDLAPPLAPLVEDDFLLTQSVLGNAALKQESLTSYELGYIGTLGGRTTLGFNVYVNDTSDNINFFSPPADEDPYTATDPPPNWPLPPASLTALAAQGVYFSKVRNQFMNLGPIRHRGIELFAEHRFQDGITGFVNYSWQPDPKPLAAAVPFPAAEISIPPRSRVNAGVYWGGRRFTGSLAMNYVERAFWVDVLPHDYDGQSPGYTTFSGSVSIRFAGGKMQATLRGTNLANADVQPNAFGDIFKRMVTAELRFAF